MDEDAIPPQHHVRNRGLIGRDPGDALNAMEAELELDAEAAAVQAAAAEAALPPKPVYKEHTPERKPTPSLIYGCVRPHRRRLCPASRPRAQLPSRSASLHKFSPRPLPQFSGALSHRPAPQAPDVRDPVCPAFAEKIKSEAAAGSIRLPNTTVIFCFCNEPAKSLHHSIYSVIDRSPRHLLHEFVLVDDGSDAPHLQKPLEDFAASLPVPVTIVRQGKRTGLMKARVAGVRGWAGWDWWGGGRMVAGGGGCWYSRTVTMKAWVAGVGGGGLIF